MERGQDMSKKGGFIIDKNRYDPEQLGLEKIIFEGRCYIDVTPLFCDCGQSTLIVKNNIEQIKTRRY